MKTFHRLWIFPVLAPKVRQKARWCAMATTDLPVDQLRKGAKVVARTDLRDVPEGTAGKIILVNGMVWTRYWVRFDNGVYLGSIDRNVLATADEWKRHLKGEDPWGTSGAAAVGDDSSDDAGGDAGGGGGGKATPSGTVVPQLLLDRSAAARKRLAA